MLEQGIIAPFSWEVAKTGHKWVEARGLASGKDLWLTSGLPFGGQWETRQYDPMEDPALFRNFAETEPTEEGILKFANRYGLLKGIELIVLDQNTMAVGESFDTWRREIRDMEVAVRVWNALEGQNADELRQCLIEARENDTSLLSPFVPGETEAYDGPAQPAADLLTAGVNDLIKIARIYLQLAVNEHMSIEVEAKLRYMPAEGSFRLTIRPKHLISLMWLQLAWAIAGNKQYRPCKTCGTWFEVSLEKNRKSRVYCEDKCKSLAFRKRNQQNQHEKSKDAQSDGAQ